MPELSAELLSKYNETRFARDKSLLCFAPFKNIYFNVIGQGAACWLTFFEAPKYPEYSVRDIWFGDYFKQLRNNIKNADLSDRCRVCENNIQNQLFMNPLARAYDTDSPVRDYPSIMELELSNRCNLACTMCNGRLSSSIRKTRDGLPPLESPYDTEFANQLEEFIPHLDELRFNGGEPFLQDICWQTWERVVSLKNTILTTIATNGTVWSDRVENMLKRGNFRINLSLDGMTAKTYESIRINSKFDRVMENIKKFSGYCADRGTLFSIMINPMRANWQEMPLFVEFCNSNGYHLAFNTVYRPFQRALWTLPSEDLFAIQKELSKVEFRQRPSMREDIFYGNVKKFENLVNNQILTWAIEQKEREALRTDYSFQKRSRQNAGEQLFQKIKAKSFDENLFSKFENKLQFLEDRVKRNVEPDDFYYQLSQLPLDWLVHDLSNKSAEQMIEEIYYRSEYY